MPAPTSASAPASRCAWPPQVRTQTRSLAPCARLPPIAPPCRRRPSPMSPETVEAVSVGATRRDCSARNPRRRCGSFRRSARNPRRRCGIFADAAPGIRAGVAAVAADAAPGIRAGAAVAAESRLASLHGRAADRGFLPERRRARTVMLAPPMARYARRRCSPNDTIPRPDFVADDTLSGFRLQRLEVLNWGNFDRHVVAAARRHATDCSPATSARVHPGRRHHHAARPRPPHRLQHWPPAPTRASAACALRARPL